MNENKLHRRQVLNRKPIKGITRGTAWLLTLSCGHVRKMVSQSGGEVVQNAHCEKCALGLIPG